MGVQAARAMLEQLRDPESGRIDIKLEPSLVVRGSTARPG
jgi:DNA-binding LacI/PurR family transcriptional regulator